MLLGEPPRSQADLNFSIAGIPVRIHPFFWIVAVCLGLGTDAVNPVHMLLWIVAVTFSILVHEMGHAVAIRRFGWHPRITLYGLGGVASYQPTHHTPSRQIAISLAGPAAGLALAGVIVLMLWASGHLAGFRASLVPVRMILFSDNPQKPLPIDILAGDLLVINFLWSLLNLLPIYPLDGGQVARELFVERNTYGGIRSSLMLSMITAGGVAVYALLASGSLFTPLLFGYLAYQNYVALQAYEGRGGGRSW